MVTKQNGQVIEPVHDARPTELGPEPGPSIIALLSMSTGLAVLVCGVVWFVMFRT